ncbi:MAG: recombinase family protein [Oscillospiraceae bacterium]|nr:recombinase family protein [Oscillospiraceae bacterium]
MSCYGYKKKAADTKDIVPNEEAVAVVKRIFELCASGKGSSQIARILTVEQVLTPANYFYRKTGASHVGLDTTRPYAWCGSSVTGILDNKVYIGPMPGLRTASLSYKNKKLIRKPESEQVLVKDAHEALITQEKWDIVQGVRKHKSVRPSIWTSRTCSPALPSVPAAASP